MNRALPGLLHPARPTPTVGLQVLGQKTRQPFDASQGAPRRRRHLAMNILNRVCWRGSGHVAGPLVHQLAHQIPQLGATKLPSAGPGRTGEGRLPLVPWLASGMRARDHRTQPTTTVHAAKAPNFSGQPPSSCTVQIRNHCCGLQVLQTSDEGNTTGAQPRPMLEPNHCYPDNMHSVRWGGLSAIIQRDVHVAGIFAQCIQWACAAQDPILGRSQH